ncbi:hypothetical protein DCS_01418 [Drechmeria coniospora]|uniref:Uncharacterized protein n=1 Tax=Drechmeria coniospora TaxID=98403 RepID=A0A151GT86_DRECN|nr:hypothetical protein DCS_01418 [Drechmeria coniospora]KYK60281.1 hypothetical protein DCS_01418 [Drechmeria coniospora]
MGRCRHESRPVHGGDVPLSGLTASPRQSSAAAACTAEAQPVASIRRPSHGAFKALLRLAPGEESSCSYPCSHPYHLALEEYFVLAKRHSVRSSDDKQPLTDPLAGCLGQASSIRRRTREKPGTLARLHLLQLPSVQRAVEPLDEWTPCRVRQGAHAMIGGKGRRLRADGSLAMGQSPSTGRAHWLPPDDERLEVKSTIVFGNDGSSKLCSPPCLRRA